MARIVFREVTVGYGSKVVISNINEVFEGPGTYVVLGRNGAGKTTLLKAIAGIIKPLKGTISVITNGGGVELIPQESDFSTEYPLSVLEYLWIHYVLRSNYLPQLRISKWFLRYVSNLLKHIGLSNELLDATLSELSAGESRLVMILRSLLTNPDILLFDEPLSSIDEVNKLKVLSVINRLGSTKLVVVTSHSLINGLESIKGIALIREGRLEVARDLRHLKLISDEAINCAPLLTP